MPTTTSVAIYAGWFLFHAIMQIYAPGPWKDGTPLQDGTRLSYRMNGWFTWWFTWALIVGGVLLHWISPTILYDQFGPLLTTVNIFTFVFCVYLYIHGKRSGREEQVSGNLLYDYFMGTALNPRNGRFDWKFFCEARPGLIGWVAINLSMAAKQYQLHGTITTPMILVNVFHFWYIADYYFHEEAILTTWDIKHENFGWMLCWGDLVWVPFSYTLQALYLVNHTHDLPWWGTAAIVALNVGGYVIFRGTNIQKHHFRTDPDRLVWGKKPEFIKTQRGSLLLISGWWGIARHINYCGDLMMGLAWCLPCLFGHILPYFYITYFTILLVHRERRDHAMCAQKYGQDWDQYCSKVRWRIVPGLY
jgi:protein-S-isoprenylcysteine O-methyltransferase Ste14